MEKLMEQFSAGLKLRPTIREKRITHPDTLIICGMGGSLLPGYLVKSHALVERIPVSVGLWNNYGIPETGARNPLVVCISYSGNTEETLSSFVAARKKKMSVIAIASGGKLESHAKTAKLPFVKIPPGYAPRNALGYMTGALAGELSRRGLIKLPTVKRDAALYKRMADAGKRLSGHLKNKVPVIYTSNDWEAIGHIWKIAFNETAKIPAFSYTLPEANHNEMEGFAGAPNKQNKNFHALFLEFANDHPLVKKRMRLSAKIWQERGRVRSSIVKLPFGDFWNSALNAALEGYAAARGVAEMRKVEPVETAITEEFKKLMKR